MTEGTIARWLKHPGDEVKKGEILLEIETDKATMELEAYEAGIVEKVLVNEGETVPIGQPIMMIGDGSNVSTEAAAPAAAPAPAPSEAPKAEAAAPAEAASEQAPAETPAEPQRSYGYGNFPGGDTASAPGGGAAAATSAPAQQAAPSAPPAENGDVRASPMARAIAREKGINLATVQGSGPGGRVIRADVEKAAEGGATPTAQPAAPASAAQPAPSAAPAAPATVQAGPDQEIEEVPLNNIRKVTGRRMVESLQSAPHFFLTAVYDVTGLVALRKQINSELEAAGDETRVSVNDLIVKACALTLRDAPDVNVSFGGDKILRKKRIHIGIAVALDNGLIVPVIRDPDAKSVGQIARDSKALIEKARAGKLTPADYSGGTFSISNLGMFGIEHFTAVINTPEAAILAVGAAIKKPVVKNDQVVPGWVMSMTMSSDHRIVDGAMAAQYLNTVKGFLEKPATLLV